MRPARLPHLPINEAPQTPLGNLPIPPSMRPIVRKFASDELDRN